MGISSPGIGSNLDVNGIVSKLMSVESQPLTTMAKKEASFQAKLSALGNVSGAVSALQGSLGALSTQAAFESVSANSGDTSVMIGSATNKAAAGIYNVSVTQLAQAQTIATAGQASTTGAIGAGGATTLTFQLGTVSGGVFGTVGSNLAAGVVSGGISSGSLTINGTAIATDATTTSAKALAAAINLKTGTTGVTATAAATATSATLFGDGVATSTFGDVDTSGTGTYTLSVGGIDIESQITGVAAGGGITAASLDGVLGGNNATTDALAAANITYTGTAALGTLQFFKADGSNLAVVESVTGTVNGGIGKDSLTVNAGSSVTASSGVTISSASASPITVGGNSPITAGLTAGSGGAYIGASFAQDANQTSGTVLIDGTNNSLQGIRDAINKASLGVTATIVSDGSDTPNHLVLTSTKTGASSTLKIGVTGSPADTEISDLLAYDPAGTQKLSQTSAAQSTTLTVNGIAVTSATNTITGAIQGVTLTVAKTGAANLVVARDSSAIKTGVNSFVKAYNDFNTTIKGLTSYNAETKEGGALLGDATTQAIQTLVRRQLSTAITGLSGNLTNLSQIGISFQKDGSLALDSGKLQSAITNNFSDISGLFAAVGKTSDSLVAYVSSTSATKAGSYALDLTALATQGAVTGATDLTLADQTIAADTTWSVTLNGTSPVTTSTIATVALTAGTYTAAQLATMLQSAISGVSSFSTAGSSVSASIDSNGFLDVKSNRYGSTSNISISAITGTDPATLLGTLTAVDGVDVAGTLGGNPVTGSGQTLTGPAGSLAEGLKLQITGGALGARGTASFSQGYAYQLNNLASTFLGSNGMITSRTNGLNSTIKDIGKSRVSFSAKLVDIEKRYRTQFTALDVMIGKMSSTSSFLTQQLDAMSNQTRL